MSAGLLIILVLAMSRILYLERELRFNKIVVDWYFKSLTDEQLKRLRNLCSKP